MVKAFPAAIKNQARGGTARDPKIHNLLRIADLDSGVNHWLNAGLVNRILP